MRISDWSSDVCSSGLRDDNLSEPRVTKEEAVTATPPIPTRWSPETSTSLTQAWPAARSAFLSFRAARGSKRGGGRSRSGFPPPSPRPADRRAGLSLCHSRQHRSEERGVGNEGVSTGISGGGRENKKK